MSLTRLFIAAGTALALWGCTRPPSVSSRPDASGLVRITARRFAFEPDHIVLKRGRTVTLELTSLDRKHGFHAPAFGVRADIPARGTARVTLTPEKTGVYPFLCDSFCGTGHEDMIGRIEVVE